MWTGRTSLALRQPLEKTPSLCILEDQSENLSQLFAVSTSLLAINNSSPTSLLRLPVRLKPSMLPLLPIRAAIRLRRLIRSRLLRVATEGHAIAASVRALDALVRGVALAEAHDGPPAPSRSLWLGIPQAVLAVGLVVRVAAAGAAADGEEPEERGDDGEGGGDPGYGEGAGAERDGDVVGFEEGVEGAG